MDQMKKAGVAAPALENTFETTSPNVNADGADDQLLTASDFAVWCNANASLLEAKRAAYEAVRQAEQAAELASITDIVIRKVAGFLEQGYDFQAICQSMLGNAYRDGARHEELNTLADILQSLGWNSEDALC